MKGAKNYRVTIRLDPKYDADLIEWLESTPSGSRSTLIRAAWRAGLRRGNRDSIVDPDELRRMMAEELERVLSSRAVAWTDGNPHKPNDELEGEYSEKLDRMLGGLIQTQFDFGEEG